MENHKLVLPEHLNHFGFLFGGHLLCWVDEIAWIAASLDYPGLRFVTVGMDQVEFRRSVHEGSILHFDVNRTRTGRTSLTYDVQVRRTGEAIPVPEPVFRTSVTLVRVDEQGQKLPLPDATSCLEPIRESH
jgi:acyl-CoA hydrolase